MTFVFTVKRKTPQNDVYFSTVETAMVSGSRVVQGQDCLGRVWESEFWAENKGGSLISVFRVSYIHIVKS